MVASAINHPDPINNTHGLFNKRSLTALAATGVSINTVVPRPYAPPVGPYSQYSNIPDRYDTGRYVAHHPRFLYAVPKRLFYGLTGRSFANNVVPYIERTFALPDVVHACHLYPDGYAMATFADRHELPMTAVAHGTLLNEFDSHSSSVKRAIRGVLERSDRVLCVSVALQERANELAPEANVEHLPIGANPDHFPTDRSKKLRGEFNIPADATVVLYCGHFTESKGVRDFIRVLPELREENVYVVCIGHGGDLRWDLESALVSNRVPGRVLWQLDPFVVRRWFAVADVFVLPSYSEGRPTVIYEAMASATPVVATRVGGIPEQIVHGESGWLFEPGDVTTLAQLLTSLQRRDLDATGANGLKRLERKGWTWNAHAQRLAGTHQNLI